jgi:uncharacterized membrane protein
MCGGGGTYYVSEAVIEFWQVSSDFFFDSWDHEAYANKVDWESEYKENEKITLLKTYVAARHNNEKNKHKSNYENLIVSCELWCGLVSGVVALQPLHSMLFGG